MAARILARFSKGDDEVLDFTIDWSALLGTDTISDSDWVVGSGLTVAAESFTTTTTTAWLSAGTARVEYEAENTIVTSGGRTYVRTLKVAVIDR